MSVCHERAVAMFWHVASTIADGADGCHEALAILIGNTLEGAARAMRELEDLGLVRAGAAQELTGDDDGAARMSYGYTDGTKHRALPEPDARAGAEGRGTERAPEDSHALQPSAGPCGGPAPAHPPSAAPQDAAFVFACYQEARRWRLERRPAPSGVEADILLPVLCDFVGRAMREEA